MKEQEWEKSFRKDLRDFGTALIMGKITYEEYKKRVDARTDKALEEYKKIVEEVNV